MKIAIAGPDGSGKSSVCKMITENVEGSALIYAGKNRNHLLFTTTLALNLWKISRVKGKTGYLASLITRYLVFYPLEYFENLSRFRAKRNSRLVIYDRHPIDRVILKYEFRLAKKQKDIRYFFEYVLMNFWSKIYLHFFPSVDKLFVLLPEPELCFRRARGQYKDIKSAVRKFEAYVTAIKAYRNTKQSVIPVYVKPGRSIQNICGEILRNIDYGKI